MSYNFIYRLSSPELGQPLHFSTESMAFSYADEKGLKDFVVIVVRYYYDVDYFYDL